MAQGAKQVKRAVNSRFSRYRYIAEPVTRRTGGYFSSTSPNIYSIEEDWLQLIHDLKSNKPHGEVSVETCFPKLAPELLRLESPTKVSCIQPLGDLSGVHWRQIFFFFT
jgi:hypothetical protein